MLVDSDEEKKYLLSFQGLSERVDRRELTLEVEVPAAWCRFPRVWVEGEPRSAELVRPGVLRVTVEVTGEIELCFRQSS